MIFEKESLAFDLLDVLKIEQGKVSLSNSGRNFDALSFRFRAKAVMKTETEKYELCDNSVCYVPSRVNYKREAEYDELIVVHFNALNYFSSKIECCEPEDYERLGQLFIEIFNTWEEKSEGYKHKCSALLYEIFAELYRQQKKPSAQEPRIERSVVFINENFRSAKLTVAAAAEKSYISEVYFRKLFKAAFGISPKKHIINLRIQYAVGLMKTGYYSLGEIAEMSGFADYKYFSTEFRRIKGVSPSKYLYNFQG